MDIEDGQPVLSLARVSPAKLAAIAEVTTEQVGEIRRTKLKLLDKKGALVDLGRHLGMFIDRTETKLSGGIPVALLTEDDVAG
jgi:phage terminase small subunit